MLEGVEDYCQWGISLEGASSKLGLSITNREYLLSRTSTNVLFMKLKMMDLYLILLDLAIQVIVGLKARGKRLRNETDGLIIILEA